MSARRLPCCPEFPSDPDRLEPATLAAWNDHLASCCACRERWLAADPVRLFGALASEPMPPDVLDRVSAGVAAAVDADQRTTTPAAVLASAAAILLAGLLGAALTLRSPGPGPAVIAASPGAVPGAHRADVQLTEPDGDVRVVDLTVGDRQVVMIFDGSLQL